MDLFPVASSADWSANLWPLVSKHPLLTIHNPLFNKKIMKIKNQEKPIGDNFFYHIGPSGGKKVHVCTLRSGNDSRSQGEKHKYGNKLMRHNFTPISVYLQKHT